MAELFKVNAPVRKPLFEGVQGENEARSIQFDITPWVEELGDGAVTATAKRSQDSQPYPVTVTKDGTTVTWKPTSTDTAFAGVGSFQLEYTVDSVLAKTCIWSTMVAPSLDPAGDPPDPYDNWLAEMRQIAADALQDAQDADASAQDAEAWAKGTKNGTPVPSTADQYENNAKYFAEESYKNAEAWAVGQRGGVDVPSTDPTYENNAKYWAEQSLANQYGAYIVKSASGEIASFSDGADDVPMKSVKVAIVPKQSGSGDPSPSNVRPISGWTDVDVFVTGKNVFGGLEWIQNNDFELIGGWYRSKKPAVKAGTYKWTGIGFTSSVNALAVRLNDGVTSPDYLVASGAIIPTMNLNVQNDKYIEINYTKAGFLSAVSVFKGQLELGTTATAYEPYTGHTTPVPLGQTVYGGTVDVTTGVLTIGSTILDLGSFTWSRHATYTNCYSVLGNSLPFPAPINVCYDGLCEQYKVWYTGADVPVSTITSASNNGYLFISPSRWSTSNKSIVINDNRGLSESAFKTAMNGVHLVCPLATPTTVQLTPAQVASLLGDNNVWADCGAVEVEYRADPTLAYAELQALILENL